MHISAEIVSLKQNTSITYFRHSNCADLCEGGSGLAPPPPPPPPLSPLLRWEGWWSVADMAS
jgi:hypothetical protein